MVLSIFLVISKEAIAQQLVNKGVVVMLIHTAVGKSVIESDEVELNAMETLVGMSEVGKKSDSLQLNLFKKPMLKLFMQRGNLKPS